MNSIIFRVWFLYALLAVTFAEIPSYIKTCKRRDPNINKCITNSIEELRDKLTKGIPELGAPSIEPLLLRQMRLVRGPAGARFDLNLTNIKVFGPSTFKISNFKADVDNVLFTFKVKFDKLSFRGKYKINTRLLLFHIVADGDIDGNFLDYDSDVILKANKINRNGNVYIKFEKMKITIGIGKSNINLSNLFGSDPVLEQAGNELLSGHNNLLLDEIRPVLEKSLSDLFTEVANKITESFTYDELFPEN